MSKQQNSRRQRENRRVDQAVLILGGFDPSGGAGVLQDCRAVRAVGVHAAAVVTVRTVQDGTQLISAEPESVDDVREAVSLMLERFPVGAVKIGALGSADMVRLAATLASGADFPPVILDPVLSSTTGGALLSSEGGRVLRHRLLPHVFLVTPNLKEVEVLAGVPAVDLDGMRQAGARLIQMGAPRVLVKGGHLAAGDSVDLFFARDGTETAYRRPRIETDDVRGTGCALSSLIAANLAAGRTCPEAIEDAKKRVTRALETAYTVGDGPPMLGRFDY